mgnify:CR=1 FL=1
MSVVLWKRRNKDDYKKSNRDNDYKINRLIYLMEKLLNKLS